MNPKSIGLFKPDAEPNFQSEPLPSPPSSIEPEVPSNAFFFFGTGGGKKDSLSPGDGSKDSQRPISLKDLLIFFMASLIGLASSSIGIEDGKFECEDDSETEGGGWVIDRVLSGGRT